MENVWEYLRGNKLAITVLDDYEDILDAACDAWMCLGKRQGAHRNNRSPVMGDGQYLRPLV